MISRLKLSLGACRLSSFVNNPIMTFRARDLLEIPNDRYAPPSRSISVSYRSYLPSFQPLRTLFHQVRLLAGSTRLARGNHDIRVSPPLTSTSQRTAEGHASEIARLTFSAMSSSFDRERGDRYSCKCFRRNDGLRSFALVSAARSIEPKSGKIDGFKRRVSGGRENWHTEKLGILSFGQGQTLHLAPHCSGGVTRRINREPQRLSRHAAKHRFS